MNTNINKPNRTYSHVNSSFIHLLTFSWTYDIFRTGNKRDLNESDLYTPLDDHASGILGDKFAKLWDEQLKIGNPSLIKVILKCFQFDLIILHLQQFLIDFPVRCIQPIFLGYMISYFLPGQTVISTTELYWHTAALIFITWVCVLSYQSGGMMIMNLGMKVRLACCSLIYRKSLRLSKTAIGKTTVGQVVNLLSNDVSRFDICVMNLISIYSAPILTLILVILIWIEIGVSSLIGVIVLCLFIPIQIWMGEKTKKFRHTTAKLTDERVRLMNEILAGIQVIKMCVWEKLFSKLVHTARRKEMNIIRYTSFIKASAISFNIFTMRLALFCTYCVYVLLGNELTAQKAFVVACFYGGIKISMTVMFPKGLILSIMTFSTVAFMIISVENVVTDETTLTHLGEILVSIKRLEAFLLNDEIYNAPPICQSDPENAIYVHSPNMEQSQESLQEETLVPIFSKENTKSIKVNWNTFTESTNFYSEEIDDVVDNNQKISSNKDLNESNAICFKDAFCKWIQNHSEYTLTKVTLNIKPVSLVAIVGSVGSGKSSLFYALLKELPILSGSVKVNGKISYASQEPWLFNGTIRENILFGSEMNRDRYNTVISKCSLEKDFCSFPNGDKTLIGDRGVGLSGGQKARINLARAVYRQADIYLLDDPLSAVDTCVSRQLFDNCIRGFLKDKTILLITHQLQHLDEVDHIIVIENGQVTSEGTYEDLKKSSSKFIHLCVSEVKSDEETYTAEGETEEELGSIFKTSSLQSLKIQAEKPIPELINNTLQGVATYKAYALASGSNVLISLCMIFMVTCQILITATDYWVAYWVNSQERFLALVQYTTPMTLLQETELSTIPVLENSHSSTDSNIMNFTKFTTNYSENSTIPANDDAALGQTGIIYIYLGLVTSLIIVTQARSYLFCWLSVKASINLHNNMFNSVIHAIMRFFHKNSIGRILNRFSNDIGSIDDVLPTLLLDVSQIFLQTLGILIIVIFINYWLTVPIIIMCVVFFYTRTYYLKTAKSLKRLEAANRSPVFSHLAATLEGMTTIRAFENQKILHREFDSYQDTHTSAWYLFLGTSRAFGLALDLTCWVFMVIVTVTFLIPGTETLAGDVGLCITQVINLAFMFQSAMRQSADIENYMISVERVLEYNYLEQEHPLRRLTANQIPKYWPPDGRIELQNVWLRYSPAGKPALTNLSLLIHPKEKIGIVGRTGAGKTSIINALFRMGYLEGKIEIDGIDTEKVGLLTFRDKLSIIPQEPILFSGTLKKNLDPYEQYNDDVLWEALCDVELKHVISDLPGGLDYVISERGSNFSIGQRQLICLARAIIRKNQILILDEATANVDTGTDTLIQLTIQNKFSNCTVLTVAHRLQTVMDSDRVLLMEEGSMVELDHAHILLQNKNGRFYEMVQQTGKSTSEALTKLAQQSYENKCIQKSKVD